MGSADENWGQWLHDELTRKSRTVVMPILPEADHPDRAAWLNTVTSMMTDLGPDTIIVAHSLGVTSAPDFLEVTIQSIAALVSVSGFADDYGLALNSYFLKERSIDFKFGGRLHNLFAITQSGAFNLAELLYSRLYALLCSRH